MSELSPVSARVQGGPGLNRMMLSKVSRLGVHSDWCRQRWAFPHPVEGASAQCLERVLPAQWLPWEAVLPGDALEPPDSCGGGNQKRFQAPSGPFSRSWGKEDFCAGHRLQQLHGLLHGGAHAHHEGSVMCQCLGTWGPCRRVRRGCASLNGTLGGAVNKGHSRSPTFMAPGGGKGKGPPRRPPGDT